MQMVIRHSYELPTIQKGKSFIDFVLESKKTFNGLHTTFGQIITTRGSDFKNTENRMSLLLGN